MVQMMALTCHAGCVFDSIPPGGKVIGTEGIGNVSHEMIIDYDVVSYRSRDLVELIGTGESQGCTLLNHPQINNGMVQRREILILIN